jgi:protein TIF31
VNNDFVEAAVKGACAIINKMVPPLNPMDPKPVQMYMYPNWNIWNNCLSLRYNNIFFSYAIDTTDRYEEVEGRYTYSSANNDLKGVMTYNNAFVHGLYTLATAVIDYRGFRMVAQSMIPGIFNPSTVVYSASDFEKDPLFSKLLLEAAAKLRIFGHNIILPR